MHCTDHNEGSSEILRILYASQTGTAADVAERIGREARRRHYRARVCAIDDCPLVELLDADLIVFVVATTGQGEEPTNMRQTWQFLLRADLPHDLLEHLLFAVYGLGDSSYPKYNWPAKKLQRRLETLGAHPFNEKGEADDQDIHGVDSTLWTWLDGLWASLKELLPDHQDEPIISALEKPPAKLKIAKVEENRVNAKREDPAPSNGPLCTIKRNERATPASHFQDVRYIELETQQNIDYDPGDVVELTPENIPEDISKFLQLMRWTDVDVPMVVSSASEDQPLPHHWPSQMTIRELCTKRLDIFSVPRRSFFEMLAYFTTNEDETEKLRELAAKEGQEDLWDYANRPRRTSYEVLTEFKSARIPVEYAADLFPELRARSFSIASSSLMHPKQIDLLVAIVNYKTKLFHPRRGVCTAWLSRLQPGDSIPFSIVKGSMRLPESNSRPLILIGPGTGIAPFRSFVQQCRLSQASGEILVFFGCRSRHADFYYKDEWARAEENGELQLFVAASRDQKNKVYVQHQVVEQAAKVWSLIKRDADIFICGSSKQMPKGVKKALTTVIAEQGNMSDEEAQKYLADMEGCKRLVEETWS